MSLKTITKLKATSAQNAILVLSNGTFFLGKSVGYLQKVKGHLCFNVSMTGYQEVLTDPSYSQYIITFTFPHVGNVGCNSFDRESLKPLCSGFILRNHPTEDSNFRSEGSFESWCQDNKLTGISGIDTRALTQSLRAQSQSGLIEALEPGETFNLLELKKELQSTGELKSQELALEAGTKKIYSLPFSLQAPHVVVIDYGVKRTILELLSSTGLNVTVVPGNTNFKDLQKLNPDGVFLSNGPGDPELTSSYTLDTIKQVLKNKIPLFGICLGHQLLALASGMKIVNMKIGHQGINHPIQNLETKKVFISSQNHGFVVCDKNTPLHVKITEKSLFDHTVEGLERTDVPAFSVQYHPEASPGPHDCYYLFKKFSDMIIKEKKNYA